MGKTALKLGGVLALSMVVLTACVNAPASTPAPTATISAATQPPAVATPTATQTPDAVTPAAEARIVLGGHSVSITDAAGSPVADVAYQGPADAIVASLTALLGQPTTTVHQNEKCVADSVDSAWGGIKLNSLGMDPAASSSFRITVSGGVPGADVETTNGARVGAPWPAYFAVVADHPMTTGELQGSTWVEVIDDPYEPSGPTAGSLVGTSDSATIAYISAPNDLGHDC